MTNPKPMVVVANLDCETVWAGAPPLPGAVRSRLALLSTTLRIFADDADALWLPSAVDPTRIPPDTFPHPRLITGALPATNSPDAHRVLSATGWSHDVRLAWAADPRVASPAAAAIARTVNDRRFSARIAHDLGVALPGARIITTSADLAEHLAAGGAEAGSGAWVAKAVWSAAGRDRVRRATPTLDEPTRVRVDRLLAIHGALAFEPWMPRTLDLGQGGHVAADGTVTLLSPHRGLVDPTGVVRGIILDDGALLEPSERTHLADTARAAGAALFAAGYHGPFVLDAFLHGDRSRRTLHPLCELNARLTFGLVARAWSTRLGAPLTLGLGGPAPAGAIPLVLDDAGVPAAWLDVRIPDMGTGSCG